MPEPFDDNNPWHLHADQLLMFYCDKRSCDGLVDLDDLTDEQRSRDYPDVCVALADIAQSRGWTRIGDCEFLCPKCSASRNQQGRGGFSRRFLSAFAWIRGVFR